MKISADVVPPASQAPTARGRVDEPESGAPGPSINVIAATDPDEAKAQMRARLLTMILENEKSRKSQSVESSRPR